MNDMIKIDHLSKRFGDVKAVQDLSFRVKEGELFAFLGINGAGKSTTINIMCGQLSKTAAPWNLTARIWTMTLTTSSGSWGWCFKIRCWTAH